MVEAITAITRISIIWIWSTSWQDSSHKLSDVVKPLRELTHKDVPFKWTDAHDKAVVESKNLTTHAPRLTLFQSSVARHPSSGRFWCWSWWSAPPE